MANSITTYKKIKEVRSTLKAVSANTQKIMCTLTESTYKTKGGIALSNHSDLIKRLFRSAEDNLADAHKAANALGGIKEIPRANQLNYKVSKVPSSSPITVNKDEVMSGMGLLKAEIAKLDDMKVQLQKSYNEINGISITEQLISSLTVIDFLFPIGTMTKATLIATVKRLGMTDISQAKDDIAKLESYFIGVCNTVTETANDFAACEDSVKRRLYEDTINTTSAITENSNTPRPDIKNQISELEKKQQEYVALYGYESPEIAEEIARLKELCLTQEISLQPNFEGHSMKQGDYYLPHKGSNWGCCCTAYSIGLSIIEQKYYNPENHSSNGCCTWRENGTYGYRIGAYASPVNMATVYDGLSGGMPSLFHYYYTNSNGEQSQHWVVINGIRKGADPDNLQLSDFTYIDPYDGKEKNLGELASKTRNFNPSGTKTYH